MYFTLIWVRVKCFNELNLPKFSVSLNLSSTKHYFKVMPTIYELYQNYPNPFNSSTKIRYQLPQESKVIIKLYDILGAEAITLLNEKKEPGVYEIDFNAQHLSSGTYIYRMIAGSFVETKKMVLMK